MNQVYVLDANNFSTLSEFYDEVETVLTRNLNFRIGRNLNAFNDVLRGGFGRHEYGESITIEWRNYDKSKRDFGYEATEAHYQRILESCHPSNRESVQTKIKQAQDKTGKTLMAHIEEIIEDCENSGHVCILEKK